MFKKIFSKYAFVIILGLIIGLFWWFNFYFNQNQPKIQHREAMSGISPLLKKYSTNIGTAKLTQATFSSSSLDINVATAPVNNLGSGSIK